MKRSLKKNFAFQAAYQFLLVLVPLVTTPYLSRVLGASNVGVYSYTYAITNYFVMFATLGVSTYGVREIAATREDRSERSKVFWEIYFSQLIVGIIVAIVYCGYLAFAPQGGFLVAGVWGLWLLSALLDISWLFFGVEEFKIPTTCSMLVKVASVALIFLFVRTENDLWVYCSIIAGSYLASQLFIWPYVAKYVGYSKPTLSNIVRHFKPSLILFIPVIAISLYTSMDKILLGAIGGMEQAGFFEYSEKLSKMPMAVITAMGTVMLPRMTSLLTGGEREKALDLLEESIWVMLAMAFALAFGIAAIAPEFAPVFLGEEFAECDSLMAVLAIIIPLISTTNVIGRQYLIPMGRDSSYTFSVCVGAAVNIVVNLFLIPRMGAMGAAIATVAAEASVLIYQAWSTRTELSVLHYFANAIPFVIIGLVMAVAVRVFAGWYDGSFGVNALGLGLEILVGALIFSVASITWLLLTKNRFLVRLLGQYGKSR